MYVLCIEDVNLREGIRRNSMIEILARPLPNVLTWTTRSSRLIRPVVAASGQRRPRLSVILQMHAAAVELGPDLILRVPLSGRWE